MFALYPPITYLQYKLLLLLLLSPAVIHCLLIKSFKLKDVLELAHLFAELVATYDVHHAVLVGYLDELNFLVFFGVEQIHQLYHLRY